MTDREFKEISDEQIKELKRLLEELKQLESDMELLALERKIKERELHSVDRSLCFFDVMLKGIL
jgi:hypothetical protein